MKLRRLALLTSLTVIGALGLIGTTPAAATPLWNLDVHHNETHFAPGTNPEYWFDIANIGDTASSGPVTLTVDLPPGITFNSTRIEMGTFSGGDTPWSCPGSPGDAIVTCTTTTPIAKHSVSRSLLLTVDVAPGAGPDLTTTATLSGGGAPEAPPAAGCPAGVGACASEPIHVSSEVAPWGLVDGSWVADFYEADGVTPVRRSGAHPERATFSFDVNSRDIGLNTATLTPQKAPVGSLRHAVVDLPPGFIGNPTAVGECAPAELQSAGCPPSSQVGVADVTTFPKFFFVNRYDFTRPVYNMAHPRGVVTDLAFIPAENIPVHIKVSLDPTNNYSVRAVSPDINETVRPFHTKVTIWGVPGSSTHDSERPATDAPEKPLLTLPFECGVDSSMRFSGYDTWQQTGVFGPDVVYEIPGQQTDCEAPRFEPSVSLEPTGKQANSPTGLEIKLHVPQNENPNGVSTPPLKDSVVVLPEGMAFSPSFADGLQGCTEEQIGLGTNDPVACPDNSRIGEVEASTPLLPKPVIGSFYLAKSLDNPFDSLIAFYLEFRDVEERGILVKVAGKVELDPATGRITASVEDLPQFPFEDLTLNFRSGARAPLTNPPTCGTHPISFAMRTYAQPGKEVIATNSYQMTEGPGGAPCQNVASLRPFEPQLLAGTTNPLAGAFSPLSLRISRTDADQELIQAQGTAPFGLTASIRGVTRCSEAQIAAAAARNQPGEGAIEQSSPSCPPDSLVGTVDVGVGAGPASNLIYVPGKIYLAGPYKGAPLSGAVIVPAVAGPVDIGNVVVRAPAYIDPVTAEIKVATDRFPLILHGVLVRIRDTRVRLDRPNFVLNPTGCEQKSLDATLHSADGATKEASNRFQVGDCGALGFKPRLGLTLKGATKRGDHPGLRALYRPRSGDANVKGVVVRLPRSAFLEQAHIRTICTRVQFAAKSCPTGAQYGYVKAWTPLLDEPLEGPVYLRSSDHKLPDLVFDLHGTVDFQVALRIDSARGGIRANLPSAPDVPLTKVELRMQGGKKGLIVNSRDLCAGPSRAHVSFKGHNGRVANLRPKLQPQCGGKR